MSVTFEPVGGWFVVAVMALAVTALTLWAYLPRMRTTTGAWRWCALGLRLAAVLLCLLAALRPSLIIQEKKKVPAVVLFLVDDSKSMQIRDEAGDKSRWELARERGEEGVAAAKKLGDDLGVRSMRFDVTLREDPVDKNKKDEPEGQGTSIGPSLIEAPKREGGIKVAAIFLLSDGANNLGMSPLLAARELRAQAIPVYTVGFGDPTAGSKSKDIAIRDVVAGPTVYVKNVLDVKGTLVAHGFAGQRLELEMYVEDQPLPVAVRRITVPEGSEIIPFSGLKYVPQTPGEKKITIKVKPKEGELVRSNNEIGTFVSVLQGGLNVLFIQGPHSAWEQKFWLRSVAESPDIQGDLRIIRRPANDGGGDLSDEDFAPGRYNVYVLSDLPANFLTPTQQALLARNVEKSGAGLIMLGGRASFGPGGWGSTPLANLLPMVMTPRDGQVEPKEGVRFMPNPRGLEKFLLQIGPTSQESTRIWSELPPLSGINHLGQLKANAEVFGIGGDQQEPVMVGANVRRGRVLAFGGETWPWRRSFHADGRMAHKKFWRQTIFWLAHKEDSGDNEVKITIDGPRRIATGQKLDFHVTARLQRGADPEREIQHQGRATRRHGEPVCRKARCVQQRRGRAAVVPRHVRAAGRLHDQRDRYARR